MPKVFKVLQRDVIRVVHEPCGGSEQYLDYIPKMSVPVITCVKCKTATPFDIQELQLRTKSMIKKTPTYAKNVNMYEETS